MAHSLRSMAKALSRSRVPNDPTEIFDGPNDYDRPLGQQRCALRPRLTQIALHRLYRRLIPSHPDRPTNHVYLAPLEGISSVKGAPKFRWSEIMFAAPSVRKGMTANLFKETP
jgi:hypothetical protein